MVKKDERARNWGFIVYPGDSLPENYKEILDEFHIQWCESPVHDKDVNPDGEQKKPHIHILVTFEGNKSKDQVKEISDSVNGTNVIKVNSVRGMVRYFIHIDNPEKHRYEKSAIVPHGGFEIDSYFAAGTEAKKRFIAEMSDWCEDNDVIEIRDLMKYAREFKFEDWYDCLVNCGGVYLMNMYLASKRNMLKKVNNNG